MFENLATKYRVVFEGRKEPVFYGELYPARGEKSEEQWDLFHYARGMKREKDFDERCFKEYSNSYWADLRKLVQAVIEAAPRGKRIGLVAIPSSTKGKVNVVTSVARLVLGGGALACDDLTPHFVRTESKEKAHDGGTRSVAENVGTLAFEPPSTAQAYDVIIVVDDILTTGNSFIAADTVLRDAGFTGTIVNFAFARTTSTDAEEVFGRGVSTAFAAHSNAPIDALVLDLDQTLLDDPVLDEEYERDPYAYIHNHGGGSIPYSGYPGVSFIQRLGIPNAIVSNGRTKRLRAITTTWKLGPALIGREYERGELGRGELPENVFNAPRVECDDFSYSLSKPCPDGVQQAVRHLIPDEAKRATARIVGLGNTLEDMLAYRAAGVEPVLALWGVPEWLRPFAKQSWGAKHAFEDVQAFCDWCKNPVESKEDASDETLRSGETHLFDEEVRALPSISSLLNGWKAAGDADGKALEVAKITANKANVILERGGYLTPSVDGIRRVTEKGKELGIMEHMEEPRRPKPGQDLVPVVRYTERAEGPVKRLILESLRS